MKYIILLVILGGCVHTSEFLFDAKEFCRGGGDKFKTKDVEFTCHENTIIK
mgnify:CR=1 FL=1